MKKIMIAAAALLFSITLWAVEPNEKVLNSFKSTFRNVKNITWNEYDNRYEVKFLHDNISTRVTYDFQGNLLSTVRYLNEDKLPLLIRMKLQKKYQGHKVHGITETTTEGETSYHVVLHDKQNWVIVNADSYGNIQLDKKYRKA
jgi:hypothetical protein